jgi:hypothetical protein
MATGTIYYWNGQSGWIKQSGVEDLPTWEARDVMVLIGDIISGSVSQDCAVTFAFGSDPTFAREVIVS